MASRAARVRTESMAVKLARQPISEGYALWDKGFTLGAMRLFIFKAETVPPFQLAGCLDAIAHLMIQVDEGDDAIDNLTNAAEKYEMIQHPILAKLMRAKVFELQGNADGAMNAVNDILKDFAACSPEELAAKDAKTKSGLARCYHYRAELSSANPDTLDKAIADATVAVNLGWDRVFLGHNFLGQLLQVKGNLDGALAAFQAGTQNANAVASFEEAGKILGQLKRYSEAIPMLEHAISLHPKSTTIRTTAFAMAEAGQEAAALDLLNKYITNPPQEEVDPIAPPLHPRTMLHKAQAAVLADSAKFDAALQILEAAKAQDAGDNEVDDMVAQIKAAKDEQ